VLDPALRDQLRTHFTKITRPVVLAMALDDSAAASELEEMLTDVAELSDLIELDDRDDERRPSFAVIRVGTDVAVHFAGVPSGHEFSSLVLAILQVGGHPPNIPEDVARQIEQLEGEHTFETFVSLSCQNCPEVVQALNVMSVLNPRIRHVAIDGARFPDEAERRGVRAVPTVFLDGEEFEQGRTTLEAILSRLDAGVAQRVTDAIAARAPFDVLVIGGGPAGAAAAIYAARKGIRTGLVAERFGGQVLDTVGIENFVSVPYTEGPELVSRLEQHVRDYEVDLVTGPRAEAMWTEESGTIAVGLGNGATLHARTVVLATGARWRAVNVPGEHEYRNKGVTYCPHCDGPLFRQKRVAVIGGGNSGVEAAIDLAGLAEHVTLLEYDDRLRADDVLQRKIASLTNVTVRCGAATTEIVGDGRDVNGLTYRDRATGEDHALDVEGVFVQIGLLPNTEWLDGAVRTTDFGEIVVDAAGRTSVPGVFAAGDCTTVPFKQIVTAMGTGSTAALSAFDHLIRSTAPGSDDTPPTRDLAGAAPVPTG
jgi:alkyl hydroperoxide reductase subunit F